MSELITRAGNILTQRMRAAQRKPIEAAETYSKLVLDPDGDPALAESLVEAMDVLGIGAKELSEDLFQLKIARKVIPRLQANREAQRRAHESIRAAELALHEAQLARYPQPMERAHFELAEAAGRACDAQREGEALFAELREHAHRIPRVIRGHVEYVERAMVEAEHRRAQKEAGCQKDSAPTTVPPSQTTSNGRTVEGSRQIAAAASTTVRQIIGQERNASEIPSQSD